MSPTKKIVFAAWLVVSVVWMLVIAKPFHLGNAIETYREYYHKTNDINDGTATSYEKREYMESGPELEDAGKTITLFLLAGFGLPWFAAGGRARGWRAIKTKKRPIRTIFRQL